MDYLGILVSSIISLVIGVLVSRHFSNRKVLAWTAARRKVLDPVRGRFPKGVEVFLDKTKVERLSEWKFGLWNHGNQPITGSDIIDDAAISLHFVGYRILKYTDPSISRSSVKIDLEQTDDNNIRIAPALLDKGDAVVFTVYTDEVESAEEPGVDLQGSLLGIPGGPQWRDVSRRLTKTGVALFMVSASGYGLAGLACAIGAYSFLFKPTTETFSNAMLSIFGAGASVNMLAIICGIILAVFGILAIFGFLVMTWTIGEKSIRRAPNMIDEEISSARGPIRSSMKLSSLIYR